MTQEVTTPKEQDEHLNLYLHILDEQNVNYKDSQLKRKLYLLYQQFRRSNTPIDGRYWLVSSYKGSLRITYTISYYHYCFAQVCPQERLIAEAITDSEMAAVREAKSKNITIPLRLSEIALITKLDPIRDQSNIESVVVYIYNKAKDVYGQSVIYTHRELFNRWNHFRRQDGRQEGNTDLTAEEQNFVLRRFGRTSSRNTDYAEMLKKVALKHYIKDVVAMADGVNNSFRQSLILDESSI